MNINYQQPEKLKHLAYESFITAYGINVNDIKVDKKYSIVNTDGISTIPLGKCIMNKYSPGQYQNDFTPSVTISFEKDNPLLKKIYFGHYEISKKTNIIENNN